MASPDRLDSGSQDELADRSSDVVDFAPTRHLGPRWNAVTHRHVHPPLGRDDQPAGDYCSFAVPTHDPIEAPRPAAASGGVTGLESSENRRCKACGLPPVGGVMRS